MIFDPDEQTVVDAALRQLRDGPRTLDELVATLDLTGTFDVLDLTDGDETVDGAPSDDHWDLDEEYKEILDDLLMASASVWVKDDGRCYLVDSLVDDRVFTYRVTKEDLRSGTLDTDMDLGPLTFDARDHDLTFPDGTPVRDQNSQLAGPHGWLDGAKPGDLVGLRRSGNTLHVLMGQDLAAGDALPASDGERENRGPDGPDPAGAGQGPGSTCRK